MIRSSTIRFVLVMQCALFSLTPLLHNRCLAKPTSKEDAILPLTLAPIPGVTVLKTVRQSVDWEQQEYPASDGIQILMQVITDGRTGPDKRADALKRLASLGPWLHNTDHIPELMRLYETIAEREDKFQLMSCLVMSDDKRALPLLMRFLAEATDDVARFAGAYALARWNIRRGVSGLINILESREVGPDGQSLGNEAMKTLQRLNLEKGWGLPEEEILRRVTESGLDLNPHQKMHLYSSEIKSWFAENEHRFPDWKLGDPLPEAPGEAPRPKGSE